MNIDLVGVGLTHSVWSSLESTISDVRTGTTKSRMIIGSYLLQSKVYKFSNAAEISICKCCAIESEDILYTCCLIVRLVRSEKTVF